MISGVLFRDSRLCFETMCCGEFSLLSVFRSVNIFKKLFLCLLSYGDFSFQNVTICKKQKIFFLFFTTFFLLKLNSIAYFIFLLSYFINFYE